MHSKSMSNTENNVIVTYTAEYATLTLVYSEDMESAEFTAVGVEATDALIAAALEAECADFTHNGTTWAGTLS